MAEEKKPPITTATATNVGDWIGAYYGDDAIDYGKKDKVRHIVRTCQFASVCFVVSKNTKQAHTDFFESNYTAIDTMYVKAAELIIRLLNIKYGAGRPLTMRDFLDCGGGELFKNSSASIDKICADYIGPGGMVEQCESCFPEPKGEDLRKEKESFEDFYEWYEPATEDEKKARALEKKKLLYKNFVDDLDNVKSDHSQLLAVASQDERNSGVLNGQSLHTIYRTATDKSAKMQRELKGQKSAIDFAIKEDEEKAVGIRYNVAKKTAKVAALGGVAAASLGAVIGGVFWPAFLIIPTYSLAKQWLPDWAKSLGEMWGHFEKSIAHKYERQKVDSYYNYLVSFMETGGKPKIRLKDRFFLTPNIIKCLKKGAKSGSVGSSYEGSDGRTHKSEIDRAEGQTSMVMGNLLNAKDADGLVPADKQGILLGDVKKISKDSPSFEEFITVATKYKNWESSLPTDLKNGFQVAYAEKLKESVENLIFNTPMESMSKFQDIVSTALKDEGLILSIVEGVPGISDVLPVVKRLRTYASKELTGLNALEWKGKTLSEYINRTVDDVPDLTIADFSVASSDDRNLEDAINYINQLQIDPDNEKKLIIGSTGCSLDVISEVISKIVNDNDRKKCHAAFNDKMRVVFDIASRNDSQKTFNAVKTGDFGGKTVDLDKFFKEMADMTYENIDDGKYADLVYDVTGTTKITPPEAGNYLRGKLGKTAFDAFTKYLMRSGVPQELSTNIGSLTTFLRKVNDCAFLNDKQKADLSANVAKYVERAVDTYALNLPFTGKPFTEAYNSEELNKYLNKQYKDGGFRELFRSNNSASVQETRNKLKSLNNLNTAVLKLNFPGYKMASYDEKILGLILVSDGETGFQDVKIRDGKDKLINFLNNSLEVKEIYSSFEGVASGDVATKITADNTPYRSIETKLGKILDPAGDLASACFFDKYAALIALKNATTVEMRKSLNQLIQDNKGSSSGETWLISGGGRSLYLEAIDAWSPALIAIDTAIEQVTNDEKIRLASDPDKLSDFNETMNILGTSKLSKEISRQRQANSVTLSSDPNLAPTR